MVFKIAGKEIGFREKVFEELEISFLSPDIKLSIPYVIITGKEPGPILYVGAGSHGDELTSILVASRLARELNVDDLKKGAIIIVPIHNPLAVLGKRRWSFIDNLDMNRVWPGDIEGNISEVIAYKLFNELVLYSDYLLDLHTAACDGENAPHALLPPPNTFKPRKERPYSAHRDKSLELAKYFGTPFITVSKIKSEHERKYYNYVFGELHVAATMKGIPGIVVELGEGGRISQKNVELGMNGVINVAKYLGIIHGNASPKENQILISETQVIRAPRGGIVVPKVEAGDKVNKDQIIAVLETYKDFIEIKSPIDGYVMRIRKYSIVEPGERIAVLGLPGKQL